MKERVNIAIRRKKRSNNLGDALVTGCYHIMRKLPGYRIEHFLRDNFYASQYFLLIELIKDEIQKENKAMEKAQKK